MQDRMVATRRPGERNARSRLLPDTWLTPTVYSMAQAAYEERCENGTLDAVRLSILADALEEAGLGDDTTIVQKQLGKRCPRCKNPGSWRRGREFDHEMICFKGCWTTWEPGEMVREVMPNPILAHLRSPGPHYRGCWAVDLVLGKE